MTSSKDNTASAAGRQRQIAGPETRRQLPAPGNAADQNKVAELLQSIAQEISQSDRRQGQALADLRSRLNLLTERPVNPPAEAASATQHPLDSRSTPPAAATAKARPTLPTPNARQAAQAEPAPMPREAAANREATATHADALQSVFATIASTYLESTEARAPAKSHSSPPRPGPFSKAARQDLLDERQEDDDSAFMDLSALAEPMSAPKASAADRAPSHRPRPAAADAAPTVRPTEPPEPERQAVAIPVIEIAQAVQRSIDSLAQRIAETEDKIDQALQRPDASAAILGLSSQIDSLRAELERLVGEYTHISVAIGQVSETMSELSSAAGQIGPMSDTIGHLNHAIDTLRMELSGVADATAQRAGSEVSAALSRSSGSGNTELVDKLAAVQNLMLTQMRDQQAADGRAHGALESIRGLVEQLHSRIDALETMEPEAPAHQRHHPVPPSPPKAELVHQAPPRQHPGVAVDDTVAPGPALHTLSREDLIASARRAAIAASQKAPQRPEPVAKETTAQAGLPTAAATHSPSMFDGLNSRMLVTLGMIMLAAAGLGMLWVKVMRKPAPMVKIERTSLPAMVDDAPDASAQSATPAPAKPQNAPKTEPKAPDTANPGKASELTPDTATESAAAAAELPVEPKPLAKTEVPVKVETASLGSNSSDQSQLPAAIGPLSLRTAAQAGDAQASYAIGNRFLTGKGVTRDPQKAKFWLERAAAGGLPAAEFKLGILAEKGDAGLAPDRAAAQIWYNKGAEHGYVQAMHNLAVLYSAQDGGTPNYAMAAKWFEQAAVYGLKDSQYNIAVLYENGLGVKKDLGAAYKWYAIAASHGDTEAGKRRDALRTQVPPGTLAMLDKEIKSWHPKLQDRDAETGTMLGTAAIPAAAAGTAVPATSMAPDAAPVSMNPASHVGDVQKMLSNLGYDPGTLDGTMTEQTRAAIRTFELRSGMAETGEISDALIDKLKSLGG